MTIGALDLLSTQLTVSFNEHLKVRVFQEYDTLSTGKQLPRKLAALISLLGICVTEI
jgi:hypothetical protein